jgi:hypothetical protein
MIIFEPSKVINARVDNWNPFEKWKKTVSLLRLSPPNGARQNFSSGDEVGRMTRALRQEKKCAWGSIQHVIKGRRRLQSIANSLAGPPELQPASRKVGGSVTLRGSELSVPTGVTYSRASPSSAMRVVRPLAISPNTVRPPRQPENVL